MKKTHKIVYNWEKIPYLIDKRMKLTHRIHLRLLNRTQGGVFIALSESLFAAHGIKLKKEDRKKTEYEIFTVGSEKECGDMYTRIQNLHQLDLTKAFTKIAPRFRKKVTDFASKTKLERMQEQLEAIGIHFRVGVKDV